MSFVNLFPQEIIPYPIEKCSQKTSLYLGRVPSLPQGVLDKLCSDSCFRHVIIALPCNDHWNFFLPRGLAYINF